jgi:tape measure domain-containing protein
MLGSAEKAKQLLKEISDFAVKTPFQLPELVEGSKKLLAYGLEADKLLPTLKNLGDIAAGVGTDKLPQLILAFGQVKTATFLTGMELRQFTEAGVPLLEELSKQSGKSAAQIKSDMEKGVRVPFSDVEKALQGMTGEGGRFFNLMARQSGTFGGIVSNIKDQIGRLARSLVGITEEGDIVKDSIFSKVKDLAQQLLDFLNNATPMIQQVVGGMLTSINNFMASGFFIGFVAILQQMGNWIVANKDLVLSFITGLAIAIGTLTVIGTIIALVNALINPVTLIIAGITLLYMAWSNNWLGIQTITQSVITAITGFYLKHKADFEYIFNGIMQFINWFITTVKTWWNEYGGYIVTTIKAYWELAKTVFSNYLDMIIAVVKFFVALFKGDWQGVWDAVVAITTAQWNIIKAIFDTFKTVAGVALKALYDTFVDWFNRIWDKAKKIAEDIREAISNAFNADKRNSPSIRDRINEIRDLAGSVFDGIQIPQLSHDIANSLVPASVGTGVGGGVVQNVTVYPSDQLDMDTIVDRLAFYYRNK